MNRQKEVAGRMVDQDQKEAASIEITTKQKARPPLVWYRKDIRRSGLIHVLGNDAWAVYQTLRENIILTNGKDVPKNLQGFAWAHVSWQKGRELANVSKTAWYNSVAVLDKMGLAVSWKRGAGHPYYVLGRWSPASKTPQFFLDVVAEELGEFTGETLAAALQDRRGAITLELMGFTESFATHVETLLAGSVEPPEIDQGIEAPYQTGDECRGSDGSPFPAMEA